MPSSSDRFDLVDFHDAPVVATGRRDGVVILELRSVNLAAEHPALLTATPVRVGPCTVAFHGVVSEEARLFDDTTREWVTHPVPGMPLDDDVIHARVEVVGSVQRYVFDGMHEAGWSEWEIVAEGFTLTWDAVLGEAWYAGLDDPGSGEAR